MGDSYIGLSDDDGAATFNPAGWALTKKLFNFRRVKL